MKSIVGHESSTGCFICVFVCFSELVNIFPFRYLSSTSRSWKRRASATTLSLSMSCWMRSWTLATPRPQTARFYKSELTLIYQVYSPAPTPYSASPHPHLSGLFLLQPIDNTIAINVHELYHLCCSVCVRCSVLLCLKLSEFFTS